VILLNSSSVVRSELRSKLIKEKVSSYIPDDPAQAVYIEAVPGWLHCDYLHELLDLYSILDKCIDMRIVSFSEARNSLKTVLDHVVEDADYTIITRRDAEDAVVMSLEYFNSLLETVYLLKSPANAAHLERSIAQFKEGEVLEHELLSD
jgi:antitoxin YefM